MKFKRTLAIFLSMLIFTLPLVSCGDTDLIEEAKDQLLTGVFRGEPLMLPDRYLIYTGMTPYYDEASGNITCGALYSYQEFDDEGNPTDYIMEKHLLTLASDGTVVEDIVFELERENHTYINHGVIYEDSVVYLTNRADENTGNQVYKIVKYNRNDGTFVQSDDLIPLLSESQSENSPYISDMAIDTDGYFYLAAFQEVMVLDENFIRQFSVFTGDSHIELTPSPDGYVYFPSDSDFDGKYSINMIDKSTKSLGTPIDPGNVTFINDIFFSGAGSYDMYYTDSDGLNGMNLSDGTHEQIMSFQNSAVSDRGFNILKILDDNTIIASERDPETYDYSISVYKKGEDVDLSETKVIEVALASSTFNDLPAAAVSFNKDNPDVRVVVTDYTQYNTPEDPTAGITKLTTDILNGIYKPDIVAGDPMDNLMRQIVENDLYIDLYTFIDNDDVISRDDLLGAYTKSFDDDDGKLWGICRSFDVMSMVAPTSLVGERDRWTFVETLDVAASLPEDVVLLEGLTQMIAPYAVFGLHGYGAFIDEETNTANFDSDDFIRYLEYISTLPAEIDYANLPADYYDNACLRRHNGQVVLEGANITDTVSWIGLEAVFGTKDFTLIGYPTAEEGESGSYAYASNAYLITTYSEYPEEAWKFLRGIVTDEIGTYLSNMTMRHDGFPIFKSAYDKLTEQYTEFEYIYKLDGRLSKMSRYDLEAPTSEDDLTEPGIITYFTAEDAAALKEFLDTNVGSPWTETVSDEITAIVNEEISVFTSGTRGAAETAEIIQSRVSIWLAEHN